LNCFLELDMLFNLRNRTLGPGRGCGRGRRGYGGLRIEITPVTRERKKTTRTIWKIYAKLWS